jgi:tripartite-type tricarboxylate transporter receptor subunit TctC
MSKSRSSILALAAGAVLWFCGEMHAQNYPTKAIRLVTAEAGGAVDFMARILAQGLPAGLGQQVIVDNRGGAQIIPGEIVARAPPDGYTLLASSGALWIGPLMSKAGYDATRDFLPIVMTNRAVLIVSAHPSVPVKSVKDLIALAKAKPGELSYASAGTGAASHLAGELFNSMAGVNILRIPYKGSGAAINDMIGGRVQVSFFSSTTTVPHVKTGKLVALAVTSADPSQLFPALPTVAASLPGYEATQMYGMFAPARTPTAVIARLQLETERLLARPEVKDRFVNIGSEVVGAGPAQLGAAMKSEIARLGKVIKEAGIRDE